MLWVMLLSKKRDFVREMEKEMEMCLWAKKYRHFLNMERKGISIRWLVVVCCVAWLFTKRFL